jgi:hypothetical protein
MAHIKHTEREYIRKYIENRFTDYIIAYETSIKVGEHIHFLLWADNPNDYHKFCQNVFKQKYNLRGRATKNLCRQYGKIKQIENIEKMMAYTVKDKNCDYKMGAHLTKDDIKAAFDSSYKKEDNLEKLNKIMLEYINEKKSQEFKEDGTGCYDPVPGRFSLNRSQFITKYTTVYFEVFGKVPTRNTVINAVVKYDRVNGVRWYLDTIKITNQFNNYDMEFIN